jgi:uncharacterized membrane protein YhfC
MGIWTIASIVCLIVAGLLLQRRNFDAAFVAAALGAVAWFLNYRSKLRETMIEETETTLHETEASEDEDEDEEQ